MSASLRKSQFSFVASFDFSLRERFFLREQEGFAFFDKIILPSFSLHVNHVKLFHPVVLDLRSVRGPELPPRGVCSAQMRSSAASFAEISPDLILGYGVGSDTFV